MQMNKVVHGPQPPALFQPKEVILLAFSTLTRKVIRGRKVLLIEVQSVERSTVCNMLMKTVAHGLHQPVRLLRQLTS